MDAKTSSSSSAFRLDGITESDLRQIAEWRNIQRDVLRSPGFTHWALQRDWLIEMRKQGGLVAVIRGDRSAPADCLGYVALYPRHGDYAELGWLHGTRLEDEDCIALAMQFARACGIHFLIAETIGKSSLTSMRQREAALEAAGFRFSRSAQDGETWRTFWTSAV